ncbi:helix-turn-helix domain-containing protein [Rhodobacterales bacterium HKCCSP123]|nr:helix-turn-helix domain-containing protein [Rhodobacterales bacterium HKCCSP123]
MVEATRISIDQGSLHERFPIMLQPIGVSRLEFFDETEGQLELRSIDLPHRQFALHAYRSTGHSFEMPTLRAATFDFAISGRIAKRVNGDALTISPKRAALSLPGTISVDVLPGTTGISCFMNGDSLQDLVKEAGLHLTMNQSADFDVANLQELEALQHLMAYTYTQFFTETRKHISFHRTALAEALILDHIIEFLERANLAKPIVIDGTFDEGLAERGQEIIAARFDEPLTLRDIAQEVGASPRSLQRAFQKRYGVSPQRALAQHRVKVARARLLSAPPSSTVTSIALSCGIFHFGRFSEAYRKTYGENPSQTLSRGKSRT